MLEYILVPGIIIGCLLYAKWKNAYLTQVMVIANFLIFGYVFFTSYLYPNIGRQIVENLAFQPTRFGQPVSFLNLITSMFLHYGWLHIIGNVLVLYLIGLPLEDRIGTKKWGTIYFTTGIIATMTYYIFNPGSDTFLLGASGAVYGIAGALLILYPWDRIPMMIGPFFSTRAPVWLAVVIMLAMTSFFVMMSTNDGVAHLAHLGGIASGMFIAHFVVEAETEEKNGEIDYELLKRMVAGPDDLELIQKIEKETEEDVKQAWLEHFFQNGAVCPKCGKPLKEYKPKITCECGDTWKVK